MIWKQDKEREDKHELKRGWEREGERKTQLKNATQSFL